MKQKSIDPTASAATTGTMPVVLRRTRRPIMPIAAPTVFFLIFVFFWEFAPPFFNIPVWVLPPLSSILRIFTDPRAFNLYLTHGIATFLEALYGLLIGGCLGLISGILMTQSRLLMNTFYPYIVALQCMPKVAIAPLLVVWFGFGITSKIIVVALLCFFPMLVNTMLGIRSVSSEQLELFRSIKASRLAMLYHLLIPVALPSILTGLELAVVVSLLGAIVGEFVGAEEGLGLLLLQAQFQMNIAGVYSILGVLALLGVIFNFSVRALRKRLLFWVSGESKA